MKQAANFHLIRHIIEQEVSNPLVASWTCTQRQNTQLSYAAPIRVISQNSRRIVKNDRI